MNFKFLPIKLSDRYPQGHPNFAEIHKLASACRQFDDKQLPNNLTISFLIASGSPTCFKFDEVFLILCICTNVFLSFQFYAEEEHNLYPS
jgi:hypothetical protein